MERTEPGGGVGASDGLAPLDAFQVATQRESSSRAGTPVKTIDPVEPGQVAKEEGRPLHPENEAGTAPGDRTFRPDVQGLRAVAILLVVLFHAGVPQLTGGFVGVDVFFVISGFVITGLLLREHSSSGRTRLLAFYGRRSRRILPAATLVIIVTVAASYRWLGFLTGNETARVAQNSSTFLCELPLHCHRHELPRIAIASIGTAELLVPFGRGTVLSRVPDSLPRHRSVLEANSYPAKADGLAGRRRHRIDGLVDPPNIGQQCGCVLFTLHPCVGACPRRPSRRLKFPVGEDPSYCGDRHDLARLGRNRLRRIHIHVHDPVSRFGCSTARCFDRTGHRRWDSPPKIRG